MFIYGCDGEYTLGFHTYLSQSLYYIIQKIIDNSKYFMLIKIKGQHFFVLPFFGCALCALSNLSQ